MMTKYCSIALAMVVTTSTTAVAQELKQEIEVQHTVEAQHYDATRLNLPPQLVLPALKVKPLAFSERTVSVAIPRSISALDPTAYADTIPVSPYNGYAAIGWLPVYNLGASAGYRLLDNDHSRLNAWMQFDGMSYKDSRTINDITGKPFDKTLSRNTLTLGTSYHLMVGRESELDLGLDYTLSHFNAPGSVGTIEGIPYNTLYDQTVNRLNGSAQWMSTVGGLAYTAGFDYSHFSYAKGINLTALATVPGALTDFIKPMRENVFKFNAAASLPMSENSYAYMGVDLSVINNTHSSSLSIVPDGTFSYKVNADDKAYNHALLSLKPRYRITTDVLSLTFGALVQFTFHSGKLLHVAPEVTATWSPSGAFTIWGKAGGGEYQNTLSSLYDVNYMTAPILAYHNSHLPLTLEGGFRVRPLRGAYAEFYGGYAVANDWLMPIGFPDQGFGPSMFRPVDVKGWHGGVALGYKYRRWADARIAFEAAPQKWNSGYYLWRDRAKYVIKGSVTSNPIDRLNVGITYELRACRALIDRAVMLQPGNTYSITRRTGLGNISSIGINGLYRFTDRLSVFLNIDNLLNHRHTTLGLVEAQGINGLAGVAYKF